MWICNICNRSFKNNNQQHYCSDQTVANYLAGKSEISLNLLANLLVKLEDLGEIKVHATKSMLVISAEVGFAYIINLGKNFIDVVLPFKEPFTDNLCFKKIAQIPGTNDFNHHLRLMFAEDLNDEVINYLKKAYAKGKNI